MEKKGYKEILLEHFKNNKSITSRDAFVLYGMTRLSAVIYNLKKDGYVFEDENITVKNRYGRNTVVKAYSLVGGI